MMKRLVLVAAAASWLVVATGCGNSAGIYPVSGKVLYRGEPAAGAVVYFHREVDKGAPSQPILHGIVEDDGSFLLTSDELGSGARPGRYAVLVEWRDGSGDGIVPVKSKGNTKLVKRSRIRSGPDRLDGRYFDISKPLLHVEVKPESNRLLPFDLVK